MNYSISAGETLPSAIHPNLTKHVCVFSILVSLLLGTVGIGGILLFFHSAETSFMLSMTIIIIGVVLLLIALFRLFWRSKELIYIPTGSPVMEGTCYLDICDLQKMSDVLEQARFDCTAHIPLKLSGNARLDYLVSKDDEFVAVQLYHFIPYTYEPTTRIFYYTHTDATNFIRCLNGHKF